MQTYNLIIGLGALVAGILALAVYLSIYTPH